MINSKESEFIPPEKTAAGVSFGNPPHLPIFEEAKVVVYGVPFDDTASFGKGCERGPEALRHVSARQIETFVLDEDIDLYEKVPIYDIGDLRFKALSVKERKQLQNHDKKVMDKLNNVLKQFEVIRQITANLRSKGKVPLMLGGEHTLTYWAIAGIAKENPLILHFDAHRDVKQDYSGMKICHTTPIFNLLNEHRLDIIQIGIRQSDAEEQRFAEGYGIKTFYPRDIRESFGKVLKHIRKKSKKRSIYITFDIDALDICYTPCTGTPEPLGLDPWQVIDIFKAIHPTAKLAGADFVEVSARGEDYREATVAVQLILRMLARDFVK